MSLCNMKGKKKLLDLPDEILKEIFKNTTAEDILNLEHTCRRVRRLILDSLDDMPKFSKRSVHFDWGERSLTFNAFFSTDVKLAFIRHIDHPYHNSRKFFIDADGNMEEIRELNRSNQDFYQKRENGDRTLESLLQLVKKVLQRFDFPERLIVSGFGTLELKAFTGVIKHVKMLHFKEENSFDTSTFFNFIGPMNLEELTFEKWPFTGLNKDFIRHPALSNLIRLSTSPEKTRHVITSDLDDKVLLEMRLREFNAPDAFTQVTKQGIAELLKQWKFGVRPQFTGMCFSFPKVDVWETLDDVYRTIHVCEENECRPGQHYITGGTGREVVNLIVEERSNQNAWHLMILYGYMQEYWEDGASMLL